MGISPRATQVREQPGADLNVTPGSVVVVRDEEWLVTGVEHTQDGALLTVQGLSELVRETSATFYERYDDIEVHDPAQATVEPDPSPGYRPTKLWLEATLRKTAVPLDVADLTVSTQMLATPLDYQHSAVRKALDPANLRPRILLRDATAAVADAGGAEEVRLPEIVKQLRRLERDLSPDPAAAIREQGRPTRRTSCTPRWSRAVATRARSMRPTRTRNS